MDLQRSEKEEKSLLIMNDEYLQRNTSNTVRRKRPNKSCGIIELSEKNRCGLKKSTIKSQKAGRPEINNFRVKS